MASVFRRIQRDLTRGRFRASAIPKDLFFDREKVIRAIGAGNARALRAAGAPIRTTAKRSMRYRKKGSASRPGTPPYAHRETGALLRKLLFFRLEPESMTMVVGPVGLKQFGAPVPCLHEFGGRQVQRRRRRGRRGRVLPRGRRQQLYPARPFMAPALESNRDQIPVKWRAAVNGG